MLTTIVTAATLLAPPAFGEIFGDLRLGDKYLKGVSLELTCGAETATGKTDDAGSFRISARTDGKCKLTVIYEDQKPALDVVVFTQPAKYRLLLELKDGKYVVKRV